MRLAQRFRSGDCLIRFLLCLVLTIASLTAHGQGGSTDQPRQVKTQTQLWKLLKNHPTRWSLYGSGGVPEDRSDGPVAVPASTGTGSPGRSETNIQVRGVDEADIVKIDATGTIYQISQRKVRIIRGHPLGGIEWVHTLEFDDPNFYPSGLYVQGDRLVVVGNTWQSGPQPAESRVAGPGWSGFSKTKVLVYNMTDRARPEPERTVSVEGYYLDSRKIGPNLYLLARAYPRYYLFGASARLQPEARRPANLLPLVSDSTRGSGRERPVRLSNVYYLPGFVEPDYVVIAGFNLEHPEQPADIKAYLGVGETVYASPEHLYLSASHYPFVTLGRDTVFDSRNEASNRRELTQLFKFELDGGKTYFRAAGKVPGTVLNSFSMDEQGKYFRIATTMNAWDSEKQSNGVYVLDDNLDLVGRVEDLAVGERISAARFLGNRCYLMTFRTVDPLFAIDLSRPSHPAVLGKLKIPGYSNYLHPYDENHILGFGKDAVVLEGNTDNADEIEWPDTGAYYQGIKLALFDVSDVAHPMEKYTLTIGDRGTDSELLWDPKALFHDPARHLFGFPIQVARIPNKSASTPVWEYGEMIFQGGHVYEITPEQGIIRRAAISHFGSGAKPGWEGWNRFVQRLFSIESSLYTLSDAFLQVHDLDVFAKQAELALPVTAEISVATAPTP
jgi:inhibitor of cysteine peptidase